LKGVEGFATDLEVVHLSENFASLLFNVVLPHLHVDMRSHLGDELFKILEVSRNHLRVAMTLPLFLALFEKRLKVGDQILYGQKLFRGFLEQ
jgi:hypothetical protein